MTWSWQFCGIRGSHEADLSQGILVSSHVSGAVKVLVLSVVGSEPVCWGEVLRTASWLSARLHPVLRQWCRLASLQDC